MTKKIFIIVFLFIFFLYLIRIGYVLYNLKTSQKVIMVSTENESIFQHQYNLNPEIFYNYSKISYVVIPINLTFLHKIHSFFVKWLYPDFLLNQLSYSNDQFQFYPGYNFLSCSNDIQIKNICTQNPISIQTEINKNLEKKIINIINKELKPLKSLGAEIGSIIIIEKKQDYNVLRAIINNTSPPIDTFTKVRLAGSTLKPFIYALSFEKLNYHPNTIIEDLPKTYFDPESQQVYIPRNHDNRFMGRITIREALANSRNIPAIEILNRLKPENMIKFLNHLGIKHYKKGGLSIALGSGGITQIQLSMLYSILANEGFLKPLIFGNYQNQPIYLTIQHRFQLEKPETIRVFSLKTVEQINSILQDKEIAQFSFGSRNHMNFIFPVSTKTGTSRKFRDSWIAGIVDNYIITIWVGRVKEEPMYGISGSKGAGRIFHQVVRLLKSNLSIYEKKLQEPFYQNKNYEKKQNPSECRILSPFDQQIFLLDEFHKEYQKIYIKIQCYNLPYTIKILKNRKEIDSIPGNQTELNLFIKNLTLGVYEIKILSNKEVLLKSIQIYVE